MRQIILVMLIIGGSLGIGKADSMERVASQALPVYGASAQEEASAIEAAAPAPSASTVRAGTTALSPHTTTVRGGTTVPAPSATIAWDGTTVLSPSAAATGDGTIIPALNVSAVWNGTTALSPNASAAPVEARFPAQDATEPVLTLATVNGISLYDGRDDVVRKLGAPNNVERDEWLPNLDVYHYSGMQIGFAEEFIQYVDIEVSRELVIDGVPVQASVDALQAAFGAPDYVAEDGLVFQREEALLKLFLDRETGEPLYVSYYHIATV